MLYCMHCQLQQIISLYQTILLIFVLCILDCLTEIPTLVHGNCVAFPSQPSRIRSNAYQRRLKQHLNAQVHWQY
jgi:hypothetical protein